MTLKLNQDFHVQGHRYKVSHVFDEPDNGLVKVYEYATGWEFTVPARWIDFFTAGYVHLTEEDIKSLRRRILRVYGGGY